ncbi:MAG TPA: radical SAM family heme chaperone HemW [Phycisphaerales bacterium]|nr:radical SAM family heme chaperone HemW [Phycisphaerales bacterium]
MSSIALPQSRPTPPAPRTTARAVFANAPTTAARSLYFHIPFCFHKCHYCDFYSIVDTRDRQDAFTDRLCRELAAIAPWAVGGGPLRTIFVGGGTPSLLRADLWQRILATLHDRYDMSAIHGAANDTTGERAEFTVECNPETVTPELMDVLRTGGVTRVSMGAQSFDRAHLKTLERWHEPANVAKAMETARAAGIARQSLDLIYAIPGQSMDHLRADLAHALALGTQHVSAYALTYEPNTAMTARLNRGDFTKADEDLEADMFEEVIRVLRTAGLSRYEVSNFAKPGAECRHNLAYWRQEQWLAAGPSASGHLAGNRWKNVPRLDDYLTIDDDGFAPITDHETPDFSRALRERIMTGLRLEEGLDARSILSAAALTDLSAAERLSEAADDAVSQGLLAPNAQRWTLTDRGFLLADRVASTFMQCIA